MAGFTRTKAAPVAKLSLNEMLANLVESNTDPFLRTGCIPFDLLTKGRGLPLGVLYQIYSDSNYGKSTLILSIAKALAEQGYKTIFAEVEPNKQLIRDMGLEEEPLKNFFSSYPLTTWDELGKLTDAFLDSDYTLLLIDSLSAVQLSRVNLQAIETEIIGKQALIGQNYLSFLQGVLKGKDKTIIYLNQIRAKIGETNPFAEKTTADGSFATRFYAAIRATIRGDAVTPDITDGVTPIGKLGTLICPEKNRLAPPKTPIPIQILFGKGVSNIYSLILFCVWAQYLSFGGSGNFTLTLPGKDPLTGRGKIARNELIGEHYDEIKNLFYERVEEYYAYLQTNPTILQI